MSVPIDPKMAIDGVTAGLGLLDRVLEMVQHARKDGHPIAMAEIVAKLPAEGFAVATRIRKRCEAFRAEFDGKNLKQPIQNLQKDYAYWSQRRYRLVREFNTEIRAMTDSINDLFTDFVAIAHCREAEELVAKSFQSLQPMKEEIDQLVNSNENVDVVLDKLVKYARDLEDRLGDFGNAKA